MIRFLGLYVGLILLLQLANESQGTFLPTGFTNKRWALHHTYSYSHSHIHNLGQRHSHSHSHSFTHSHSHNNLISRNEAKAVNAGGEVQGQDVYVGGKGENVGGDVQTHDLSVDDIDNGGGYVEVQGSHHDKKGAIVEVKGEKATKGGGDSRTVDVATTPDECIVDQGNAIAEVVESNTMGTWQLFVNDSGVSAMHIQIMPNNKAIYFDAASLGPSNLKLAPNNCRVNIPAPTGPVTDCFAHGAIMDIFTGQLRPLKVTSDIWCSSGALDVNGELVNSGGWADGEASLRYVGSCDTCDFRESPIKLSDARWYGTHVQLPSGEFMVVGGRHSFTYEFLAPEGKPSPGKLPMVFLNKTNDRFENNLYPFISVAPDGNLFMFGNFKSVLFDPVKNVEVREFPDLPGGARNYPGSGSATTLPIKLKPGQKDANDIEFLVCGGGSPEGFYKAESSSIFDPALDTCGRMKFMQPNAQWEIDTMPSRRVMGDMLNLPNGQILILNGAQRGVSGWTFAEDPNLTPLLYSPNKPLGARFRELQPSTIARMYHSVSALIPTGEILVAGSNSNNGYIYTAKYPTELRFEKFAPPYLDKSLDPLRPALKAAQQQAKVAYGQPIVVPFELNHPGVKPHELTFSLYKPPFTTHGYSMNQRILELAITCLKEGPPGQWTATFEAPNGGQLAPPGYYNTFLSFRGVPAVGSWIQLLPKL